MLCGRNPLVIEHEINSDQALGLSLAQFQEVPMRAVDLIIKKRDGGELTGEELEFFIQGFTSGEVPDYQASAWAMAVLLNGMTSEETANLTRVIANSGETLDLSGIVDFVIDKHSTGGVGDKTSLVVLPAVAACGVPVGKMSGRGLGYSGGTLDKLESIDGYRVDLSTEEFLKQLQELGLVLSGQSADLAPADGKLYALRDVTGTVPSIPLIASSIMSKKLAAGADGIVLDVKVGSGAFIQDVEEATYLAEMMIDIGTKAKRKVVALISDMNQPLGKAVGNALEMKEAIATLGGSGPEDFFTHCLEIAAHMLVVAGHNDDLITAKEAVSASIQHGEALEAFRNLIIAQGGNVDQVDDPQTLPVAPFIQTTPSPSSGYIREVNAREIGLTSVMLGAGRMKKADPIDHSVGLVLFSKVGQAIEEGEPLFEVHAADQQAAAQATQRVLAAHQIARDPVPALPLFYKTVG
jgi:pyrimidine-nucleoside phosphorylase